MNVFVLGTGRCGTTTFMRACNHVTNCTSGHETRVNCVGPGRLSYPENHIEADNRLSWFLGRLEETYGDQAFYVHMTRNEDEVVRSYLKRWKVDRSIVYGYRTGIVPNPDPGVHPVEVVRDMCRTINANVRAFMADKPRVAVLRLENAEEDFTAFWKAAEMEGDLKAALQEWTVPYNASRSPQPSGMAKLMRAPQKFSRILQKLPDFIDRA